MGTGAYDLDVQIVDELGFEAASDVLVVTMAEDRPSPPTPTPQPTATPQPVDTINELANRPRTDLLLILVGFASLGIILLMIRFVSRERQKVAAANYRAKRQEILQERTTQSPAIPVEELPEPMSATLIPIDAEDETPIPIETEVITIGRDTEDNDLVLEDRSVSPLHARIRDRNGRFWLYDEGSENGTFLNHTRLGLSPKLLNHDDTIRIGRSNFGCN